MRSLLLFLLILISSYINGKEKSYTGSTPAGLVVRSFLDISLTDSIDFIRWKLTIDGSIYKLACTYGIGKPNTNGFLNGGKKLELTGQTRKQNFFYRLLKNGKELKLFGLNENLLHLADADSKLLTGNGGWSYTLNALSPVQDTAVNIIIQKTRLKDSMVLAGRTPCGVPGIIHPGDKCYKLKWKIILYANAMDNLPSTFRIYGTPWRQKGVKTGRWKILQGKNDQLIYQLNDENDQPLLSLLKMDENIFIFLDQNKKPLVGDEDFSFTLSKE